MKVLFFAPHAAIWVHALPENRLARELRDAGHEVTYVSCGKAFQGHCTCMSAYAYEVSIAQIEKDVICRICRRNAGILSEGNGARHLELSAFLNEEAEAEVTRFYETVQRGSYINAVWRDIGIGRIATYELFLKYKKMSMDLNDEEWEYYSIYLKNAIRSAIAFDKIFAEVQPDVVFFYSPQYAVSGSCAEIAMRRGATAYFIEGSSSNAERYDALRIWDWSRYGLMNPALANWSHAKERVTVEDVERTIGHFDELFAGTSFAVYSSPLTGNFSARQYFEVPQGAKLVLLTLSSFDEAFAAVVINKFSEEKLKSDVFTSQFEWVENVFEFVKGREDICLVVRVHPRDFPNKRESVKSEQAEKWIGIFEKKPENVRINWPKDEISLYDILQDVDVVLTGWSATGVEALAFGRPVVTYDRNLPSYPDDIHFTGTNLQAYFANIDRALACERTVDFAVGALRWLAVSFSIGTVRISGRGWLERLLDYAKRRLPLSEEKRAKLDLLQMRLQARTRMAHRGDAKRLRRLVDKRSTDLFQDALALGDGAPLASRDVIADRVRRLPVWSK